MHPNEKLIEAFYTSFKGSDFAGQNACYAPEVEFSDPVFPALKGKRAMAMWAMLGERKADPSDRWFEHVKADDARGSAHWEAKYKFPLNGRPVHNKIDAQFEFKDGKIVKHTDAFDFWKWSQMALGLTGTLFGWSSFFQSALQKKLGQRLDEFIAAHPEYQEP
jgi:ketosteroid isomerase-like protein